MSKNKDIFIHGICNATGFVKHWPRDKFYVKDGKIYLKGDNSKPLGVEDNSVMTAESSEVLDMIAERDGAGDKDVSEEQTAVELPAAEAVVTASQESETPSQTSEAKPKMADTTTQSTSSNETKENTVNSTTSQSNASSASFEKKTMKTKPMTATGAAVRIVLALAILFAAIFAISMGMNYAFAYIATLGLSEAAVLALSLLLGLATAAIVWFIGNIAENYIQKVVCARKATKFEEALASAEAVAA